MLTLHIGVGKTATTTLQAVFFPRHPGIRYLGKGGDTGNLGARFSQAMNNLIRQDGLNYDPEPGLQTAAEALRQAEAKGLSPLYSDENIIDGDKDKGLIIERLRRTFAPCRILLTLREQRSFLRSLYGHDNNKLKNLPGPCNGLFVSLEDWLEYHQRLLAQERGWFWLAQYHRLARALARTFGRENLLILTFEEFKADLPAYLDKLCSFLGVHPDKDLEADLAATRFNPQTASRWFQKQLHMQELKQRGSWLAKHPSLLRLAGAIYSNRHREPRPVDIQIPPQWDARLCGLFRDSNRALAQEFNLPLEKLGYAL